jgi:hypothetical protein
MADGRDGLGGVVVVTIQDIYARMMAVEEKVDRLLICWGQRSDTCPYRTEFLRDEIAGAGRESRLKTVEDAVKDMAKGVTELEKKMIGAGVIGGGSVTGAIAIVYEVGKAAHWW